MRIATMLAILAALAVPAAAGKIKEKEPGPKSKGKAYEWKSGNGISYVYFVPKSYDPKRGTNLTFILHGSNGTRYWSLANCPAGKFRADDIVVSPDGTTPNGRGGFNSLGQPQDARRFLALHQELKQIFNIRRTFLYGHSQGSFFSLYYAGEYPKEVDGVVAFASGVWTQTKLGKNSHHQAIVLLHGTQDPVVPYAQSVGAFNAYRDAKYPILHFKSIEGWNHWPTAMNSKVPHTQQQLAWCEGMITDDAQRQLVSLEFLLDNKSKDRHDYGATYSLAKHVAGSPIASTAAKKRAHAAMTAIEAGAQAHVAALSRAKDRFEARAWLGHLPMFLRAYRGVPARDAFAQKWEPVLEKHKQAAVPSLRTYYQSKHAGKIAEAFAGGVAAIQAGYLHYECADREFLKTMTVWAKDAKKLGLPRHAVKTYKEIVPGYEKSLKDAYRSFDGVNRKVKF